MRILSFSIAHDSSVCSLVDGKIEFFCKEERLSGVKKDMHPFKSLDLYKSLRLGKIDHILYNIPSNNQPKYEFLYKKYIEKIFDQELENFSELNHHRCHASLAFYNSGFEEAIVIVVDRNGSIIFMDDHSVARESESVFLCSYPSNFRPLYKSFWIDDDYLKKKSEIKKVVDNIYPGIDIQIHQCYGIVKVYEAATTLINQHPLENGKTMGLSAYGYYDKNRPLISNNTIISDYFSTIDTENFKNVTSFFGLENLINHVSETNHRFYADKAMQVQTDTQQAILDLIKKYTEKTGIKKVCIVGGYGLNVVANAFYIKNLPEINFYFEPLADDTGISIGAAMLKYRSLSKDKTKIVPKDNFFHFYLPEKFLDLSGLNSEIVNLNQIVDLLEKNKSVAIFEGNPEAGPRALGHRSILFDARNLDAKKIVNTIKKREWYRPFAGVILKEKLASYFVDINDESRYMTVNFDALPQTKNLVPGIIHVDGTCRIQTVDEGFLFHLLEKFYENTGCPMLLNTSFNLAGAPLVQTKKDAINTLKNSNLDYVYFVEDNILVSKKEKK